MGNIRSYVGDMTFEECKNDRMRVDAVVRNFEVIGEAVKNQDHGIILVRSEKFRC
jgi:uncharacterized protein with HEPN domain